MGPGQDVHVTELPKFTIGSSQVVLAYIPEHRQVFEPDKKWDFKIGFSDRINGGIFKCHSVSANRTRPKIEFSLSSRPLGHRFYIALYREKIK